MCASLLQRFKIVISKFGCDNENVIENNKFRKTVKLLLYVSIQGEEISSIKKKKEVQLKLKRRLHLNLKQQRR